MNQREQRPEDHNLAPIEDAPVLNTSFALPIYADATLAGLTPLVPVPILDWWLEERFRRWMVGSIATYRGQELAPEARQALTIGGRSLIATGLLFLLKLPLRLLLKLVRKIVYVLAVKEATEKLSHYWQRAFLIDHMIQAGHLKNGESAQRAQQAMQKTLAGSPSPLIALAGELVQRVWRLLPFHRRSSTKGLGAAAAEQRHFIERQWVAYEEFLIQLAERYNQAYRTAGRE